MKFIVVNLIIFIVIAIVLFLLFKESLTIVLPTENIPITANPPIIDRLPIPKATSTITHPPANQFQGPKGSPHIIGPQSPPPNH